MRNSQNWERRSRADGKSPNPTVREDLIKLFERKIDIGIRAAISTTAVGKRQSVDKLT
jgi:hypothetical protein